MTHERVIYQEDYFTTCVRQGCDNPATNHPLRCDKHRYYMLPCACTANHYEGGCWFAYYDPMEYAKAQRLAREEGLPSLLIDKDGNPVPAIKPYKPCGECHSCAYARLGLSSQLQGWPD